MIYSSGALLFTIAYQVLFNTNGYLQLLIPSFTLTGTAFEFIKAMFAWILGKFL